MSYDEKIDPFLRWPRDRPVPDGGRKQPGFPKRPGAYSEAPIWRHGYGGRTEFLKLTRGGDLGGQETINCLPRDIIVSFAPKLSPAHWPLVVREQLLVVSVQLGARRQPTRCAAVWGGPRRSDALRVRRPSSPRPRRSRGSSLAARSPRAARHVLVASRRQAVRDAGVRRRRRDDEPEVFDLASESDDGPHGARHGAPAPRSTPEPRRRRRTVVVDMRPRRRRGHTITTGAEPGVYPCAALLPPSPTDNDRHATATARPMATTAQLWAATARPTVDGALALTRRIFSPALRADGLCG